MRKLEQLLITLSRDAAIANPAPHPYILSMKWIVTAAIYLAVTLLVFRWRPDLMQKLQDPWFVAEIAALAVIFIATSLSAALLSFPDLHQMRRLALAPALLLALFLPLVFFSWSAANPLAILSTHTYECTLCLALIALLPATWIFFEMRKNASTHSRWAGAMAVLSALSIGALWLRLHEVNDSIGHVIEWHYLPMIGFGIVGAWLGKILLKW
ncbi:MAG: DUF1109 domain-containing protein [Gammaproteobacteria bacterium]|nr:DUF1109 domain-containing protein [Gammaproteobacteria bacterium]